MKLHDYLNPKSMITPGVAGMVIMGISNALWVNLSISKVGSSLFLSFLLALLVLKKIKEAALYEKAIYLVFNTLIIFSLAVNTNFAGNKLSEVSSQKMGVIESYSSGYSLQLSSEPSYSNGYQVIAAKPFSVAGCQLGTSATSNLSSAPSKRRFFDPYF